MIAIMAASFGEMYVRAGVPTDQVVAGFLIPRLLRQDVPTVRMKKIIRPTHESICILSFTYDALTYGNHLHARPVPTNVALTGNSAGWQPHHAS